MVDLNVSVSEDVREWIEEQVRAGRYANAGDYVRELIQRERQQQARKHVEDLIREGIESGPATPLTQDDWDSIRAESDRRIEEHKRHEDES